MRKRDYSPVELGAMRYENSSLKALSGVMGSRLGSPLPLANELFLDLAHVRAFAGTLEPSTDIVGGLLDEGARRAGCHVKRLIVK
jgi:hypothetical protein